LNKAIRAAVAVLVALEVIYLLAVNVFLNTSLAPAAINRHPARFEIRWRWGWSGWPGMTVLHGVETRGRSRRIEWDARLDSVSAQYHLMSLFHRTVELTSVAAGGVVYRQRRLVLEGAFARVPAEELPPILQTLDPSGPPRPNPAPSVAKQTPRPWTILADRIACDLDELWLDRFRLTGAMHVETGMSLVVHGPIAFPDIRVTMASGDLRAGPRMVFGALGMDVQAEIHPFLAREVKRLQFLHYLSGRFAVRSDDASLFFLEAYFRKTPWIRFNDRGAGRVVFLLDHGRLLPASTLDIANDNVDVEFLDRHVTGRGIITGRIETFEGKPRSRVSARLEDFHLAAIGGTHPFAAGRLLTIESTSTTMDLGDPFADLHVVVDLPEADLLDLTFYNAMIPAGSKFRFVSGIGTISYHLEDSSTTRSMRGTIDFVVREGVARFEGQELRGGFALNTRLKDASALEKLFDISGTSLTLHASNPKWKAVVRLPEARMTLTQPTDLDAKLRLEMQDTRPIISLYDALKGVPHWMQRLLVIQDLQGSARLAARNGSLDVQGLEVTGHGLRALADLRFDPKGSDGLLYVRLHGLSLGIERSASGREIKILRPLAWFERQRAARGGVNQSGSSRADHGE
jgi:hypothetical protein